MMDNSFSLLDEPWVQVVYPDGHRDEISLRRVFSDAPKIRGLSGDIPQQKLPILRLLLAILYRAYCFVGADADQMRELWKEVFSLGHFHEKIVKQYLDKWKNRFFLIGERPFFQVPDLEYASEKPYSPVSEMIADVPKPEKYLFSMRSMDAASSLSFAEASRWLVFMQAYDIAGIKTPVQGNTHVSGGKVPAPTGMLQTGWLGAIGGLYAEGRNLFETLMLNWVLYDTKYDSERYQLFGNERDIPVWEKDKTPPFDSDNQSTFAGPVQALTWQSRRIRLVPNEDCKKIIGVISCYGDAVAQYNNDGFEKMTVWRKSISQQKKLRCSILPYMPVTHDAGKALWRGLEPILCVNEDGDSRPGLVRWLEEIRTEMLNSEDHVLDLVTIHAQGMTYGKQNSVFETGIDDTIALNTVMFRHDYAGIATVMDVVKCADSAVQALTQFVRNLQVSVGDKSKSDKVVSERVRESAYADLDILFRNKLATFDESKNPSEYSNDWKDEIHHRLLEIGRNYLDQSPVPVFEEHEFKTNNKGKSSTSNMMSATRAQISFQSKLNEDLGSLRGESLVYSDRGEKMTMPSSTYNYAHAIGKYAAKLIFSIQSEYTSEGGSSASSRARLSRLRRDLDGRSSSWMLIGDELFADWPQDLASPSDNSPEFDRQINAVRATLGLYAVHQQSKGQGVAQSYLKDLSERMTFGRACKQLAHNLEQGKGVLRRLRVAENAPDFNGTVRSVRALITLMRGSDIQIDYSSLAHDLYLMQFSDYRGKVFQRWGKDYYWEPAAIQQKQ